MRRLFPLVAILLSFASPVAANRLTADRFDVTIRTLADGSIQVTETMRLQFVEGAFTYVSREIPLRKTDGIEVLGASMDGRVLPRGGEAGQFDVRRRDSRVAIRWHFASTGNSTHEFRVSYLARGVVRREGTVGFLEWQALPTRHAYAIASARIVLEGEGLNSEPSVRTRDVASVQTAHVDGGWAIEARTIDANGWLAIATPSPLAADAVPRWQRRAEAQRARAPQMLQFAAIALVLCVTFVLLVWRQYPAGPLLGGDARSAEGPPASRPPAIAAAILAGGHSTNAHAPGTLFDLASRGVLSITQTEGRWKALRKFTLTRQRAGGLAPHEAALLDVMFRQEDTVDFSKAAARLARGGKPFRHEVNQALQHLGLTDEQRRAVRRRLFVTGIAMGIGGVAALAVTYLLAPDAGPWSIAIVLAIELAGALAIVLAATRAELSDDGLRERQAWLAFRRGLKDEIVGGSTGSTGATGSRVLQYLPYVAAMGLAAPLSRFLKRQGASAAVPSWFHTLAGGESSAAFAAFVGATSASTSAGGASGAGAAGGGSAGAG